MDTVESVTMTNSDTLVYPACRNLIAAIFLRAWSDSIHRDYRKDAMRFFASKYAVYLAEMIDLTIEDVRKLYDPND